MKKILALLLTVVSLSSCMPESKNKHLTYQNIVILSDMSSRIRNPRFPQKDIEEIHKIVQDFKNECVKPGEKIGDQSIIAFSAFSEKSLVSIDIGARKDLSDRQAFINSTGIYENCGLEKELTEFENSIKKLYNEIANPGLDLISILIEKIENKNLVKRDTMRTDGIDTTFIHYENHVYIFTDGYLEYAPSQKIKNSQYYYGEQEINNVRQFCIHNSVDVKTALEKNKTLRLPSCNTNNNQYINLHVLETHERDKNVTLQTYNHPTSIRDNEILEAVWQKWRKDSGFKSFDWKKY
jgi:hypothetical protein